MKVLQILNHFLPQQTAGTEVYSWALSKELCRKGIEVIVVIPNYGKSTNNEYEYDGLPVYQFAEPSIVDRGLIMGFRVAEGLKTFSAFLEKEKPDIVHFHELAGSNGIGISHVRVAKKLGYKIVMSFHLAGYSCKTGTLKFKEKKSCDGVINRFTCSTCYLHKKGLGAVAPIISLAANLIYECRIDPRTLNNPIATAFGTAYIIQDLDDQLHELINLSNQVVCLTHWFKDILLKNKVSEKKISYIPQGLPTPEGNEVIKKNGNHKLRLLFLGRISQFKGLHLLIRALESIPESEIELSIFGQGDGTDYESNCREQTKDKSNIHWMGNLSQKKVIAEMRKYDLLCLCSTFSEMSPLVIQEARAARLPIIASNVYGNMEQLENGAGGILFEMNNYHSLKKQLLKILANRNLLREFLNQIIPPTNFHELGQKYIDIYEKILTE
jgi:glycosyltransferase involved in cell wall biosynthesis